jgi:hypothetical protein
MTQAYLSEGIKGGCPVSIVGYEGHTPIAGPYNGENFAGVSNVDVVDYDIPTLLFNVASPNIKFDGELHYVIRYGIVGIYTKKKFSVGELLEASTNKFGWKKTKNPNRANAIVSEVSKGYIHIRII